MGKAVGLIDSKVLRGGSWLNFQYHARADYRSLNHPGFRYYFFGFRVISKEAESSTVNEAEPSTASSTSCAAPPAAPILTSAGRCAADSGSNYIGFRVVLSPKKHLQEPT